MLIKCPKCQLIYKIDDTLMTDKGLKMHCQHCEEVFKAYPEDAVPDENEKNTQKENIVKAFKQMLGPSPDVFESTTLQKQSDIKIIRLTRYKNTVNYTLLLFIFFLLAALLYVLRYDIVRYFPKTEKFYQKLGIESVYNGHLLEFSNIKTEEFIKNNVSKLKISGVIRNPSNYAVNMPPLKAVIYNFEGKKVLDTTHYLPYKRIGSCYIIPFEIVVTNPTPKQKNVQITFAEDL